MTPLISREAAIAAIASLKIKGMRAGHLSDQWDGALFEAMRLVRAIQEIVPDITAAARMAQRMPPRTYRTWKEYVTAIIDAAMKGEK